jgi:ectoine hydroxylase-related dioxygenase (phytanoyl-CoA dioxygenase family)
MLRCSVISLEEAGYQVADLALSKGQCEQAASSIPGVSGGRAGVRDLILHPTVVRLLAHKRLAELLWSVIGRDLVAVKATLFDKTPDTNWRVRWHQDRVLAVKERLEVPGFGPWSVRCGSAHVDGPASVLAQMVAARIHLDACGPENGPLRVIPGSHLLGKLSDDQLAKIVASDEQVEVCAPQGAIVLMRPLLIHASSPSRADAHRRVLHIEFAPAEAISPLLWETAIHLRRAA